MWEQGFSVEDNSFHSCCAADGHWTLVLSQGFGKCGVWLRNYSNSVIRSKQRRDKGPGARRGPHQCVLIGPGCGSSSWIDIVFTHSLLQLGRREFCSCVYHMIENLSSTALNCWLVWPCQHSPFVSLTASKTLPHFHSCSRCKCYESKHLCAIYVRIPQ